MSYRCIASTAVLAASVAIVLLAPAPAAGQALSPTTKATAAGKTFTPARTPDGQPDLQGVWTNNTVTPLERSKGLAGKEFYTDEELAANQKKERDRLDQNLEEGRPTEPGTAADVHYDFAQFGLDRGQAKLVWDRRTSIIVGPEGRMPPLTPEARQRLADARAKAKGHELDGPENRPLGARCIARANVGPPMLPIGL